MKQLITYALSSALLAGIFFVTACTVTRKPDGTIIAEPAGGKPVEVPPRRVTQITINGQCYLKFEAPDGIAYCIPCDLEGTGYAEPCNSLLSTSSQQPTNNSVVNNPVDPTPYDPPSPEEVAFMAFFNEWLNQEGLQHNHDSVWFGFELDKWTTGNSADVPIALVELSDDPVGGFIKVMIVSRTDWADPDITTGGNLEYYFLQDASDMVPDAMILQLSGTFQEVADAMKGFFDGQFLFTTDYLGSTVFIAGDDQTITFSIGQSILWQG